VINHVCAKARVFIPDRPDATVPEPDVAAYHDFPHDTPLRNLRWEDVSPILVVEVLDEDNPDKDLDRNVKLYRQVPSIQEYWVIDPRPDPEQPTLIVYRRSGKRWRKSTIDPGDTYTTRFLPDFELIVDPRR
jgi:Uma2 family endonuclease